MAQAVEFKNALARCALRQQQDGQLVVPWRELRKLSAQVGLTPREGEIRALETGFVPSRYMRHTRLVGLEGQIILLQSQVLIAGCGGLGCFVAELLARAGVGALRLVDSDVYDDSNLNRQLACTETTLGQHKAQVLAVRVHEINSAVHVSPHACAVTESNVHTLLEGCQAVVDALDNLASRTLVHTAASRLHIPLVYGAVDGYDGECSLITPDISPEVPILPDLQSLPVRLLQLQPDVSGCTVAATAALQTAETIRTLLKQTCTSATRWFRL